MPEPEVWLRGPIGGVPSHLQPVAHSLRQCGEELERLLPELTTEQIWRTSGAAASIGFHVRHAIGSLDRLFTYARGAGLSESQRQELARESQPDPDLSPDRLLAAVDVAVTRAIDQLRGTGEDTLLDRRLVGRAQLPSTVIGLLFHAAEHMQRHAGQAVTTARFLRSPETAES